MWLINRGLTFKVFGWVVLMLGWIAPVSAAESEACNFEPKNINLVYGANPVVSYLLVALAPEKMIGWNFEPPEQARGIFAADSFDKPIIGGWFGQGRTPNMEALLKTKPDLIIMSDVTVNLSRQESMLKLGLPVCRMNLNQISDYPASIRAMGQWLDRTQKAETFARLAEKTIATQAERRETLLQQGIATKTVYYAESPSGLQTECVGSIHSEVIPLAGAKNPHICPAQAQDGSRFGKVSISFEQLLRYNPDAIVTQEKAFFDKVYQDPKWALLDAVKNKQVFFMPQTPFRWMDRPPSYMRLLAMQWLMEKLYPDQFDYQLEQQTKLFFSQVFEVDLTPEQLEKVLQGGVLND